MPTDSVQRFSNRVESYAKYRPHYPAEILSCLQTAIGLTPATVVADIGSGTGLLTQLFVDNGNPVYAVEPNAGMRQAAEAALGHYANLHSVDGRSEATTLPSGSVDLVTAAQAFHWFEPLAARAEFARILRPLGWVALVWNNRRDDASPFLAAYRQLLDHFGTDYRQVDHKHVVDDAALNRFFAPDGFRLFTFANHQTLDFEGLLGRLRSTSYIPAPGDSGYAEMHERAKALYDRFAIDGNVRIEYDTQLYLGRVADQ